MKQKHVILRSTRVMADEAFNGPLLRGAARDGGAPALQALRTEVAELERREVPLVTRDASIVAVAPAMPMQLIEPRQVHDPSAQESGDLAWGVEAVRAHSSRFDGNGAVVAVLDTGIDATHEAFAGVELVQRNFTSEADADLHGHGTHCAGTIFGRKVGSTRIGVAPGVKKALIGKVLGRGGGSSEQIVSAIQWALDNGAHVISMSLGMDFPGYVKFLQEVHGLPVELATSRALEGYRANVRLFDALAQQIRVRAHPTVVVAAAGNESDRVRGSDFEVGVAPPAVALDIVSVGALGRTTAGLDVAEFSNTGPNLSGPGVDIVSARAGGGLRSMSGTSMATPHVAGVAALWVQALMEGGMLNALNLTARLVGLADGSALRAGVDRSDVGAGLVVAPQG